MTMSIASAEAANGWGGGRRTYLANVLAHDLNHVGHGEVHDIVSPRQLEDGVGPQQVVALEQRRREALVVVLLQEPRQQLLGDLRLARLRRVLHRVLHSNTTNNANTQQLTDWQVHELFVFTVVLINFVID